MDLMLRFYSMSSYDSVPKGRSMPLTIGTYYIGAVSERNIYARVKSIIIVYK